MKLFSSLYDSYETFPMNLVEVGDHIVAAAHGPVAGYDLIGTSVFVGYPGIGRAQKTLK